ncbi:MAG TPA: trypsin-like peptidase domain-containing protein [Burkholderiaceae bacterium]|nr:trypsin-like peptidase domain-containing protein [Burkholderiaceae bacterium]
MLHRLWLTFAQAVTVGLAVLFIVATLRPEWLPREPRRPDAALQPHSAADGAQPILSYAEAARRATPAVVNIFTSRPPRAAPDPALPGEPALRRYLGEPLRRPPHSASLGSGVIASPDGLILTNHHVIDAVDELEVLLADGRRAKATVLGVDPETDLAVLRIALPQLPSIEFGDSDSARIGDVVLAIGNPFGVGLSVTMGIVSATGRTQLGINTFENFIQTDAAINPGNSGGALVDAHGRLLGINTAIYSRTGGSLGIGFAIPASSARSVMEQLAHGGTVVRGYIGVEPQDVTDELAQALKLARRDGAVIAGVMRGGPADRAGVRAGDLLLEIDGQPVANTAAVLGAIAQMRPGSTGKFRFLRQGNPLELSIAIGTRPKLGTPQQRVE